MKNEPPPRVLSAQNKQVAKVDDAADARDARGGGGRGFGRGWRRESEWQGAREERRRGDEESEGYDSTNFLAHHSK